MTWEDTATGLTRPSLWDMPGHKKLSAEDAAVLDTIEFLVSPPRALIRQTSAQTFTTGVAAALTFSTEDFDSHFGHDNSVNNSRYTIQVAGYYRLSGKVGWAGNATGRRLSWWRLNGTNINPSQVGFQAGSTADVEHPAATLDVLCVVGDYIELAAMQDSGGNLNTIVVAESGSYMNIRWVGFS